MEQLYGRTEVGIGHSLEDEGGRDGALCGCARERASGRRSTVAWEGQRKTGVP